MLNEEFEAFAVHIAEQERLRPLRHKILLIGWAVGGYVFFLLGIPGLLVLAASFLAASVVVYIAWLTLPLAICCIVLAWVFVRSLWVPRERPQGIPVSLQECPLLLRDLTEIDEALAAPRPHDVLIYNDFNACLIQRPRLGVFGLNRNSVQLGLTLMAALEPAEFRSVIAHELGHLSANHGHFGTWVYRIRNTWFRMRDHLDNLKDSRISYLDSFTRDLRKLFQWYIAHFDAYAFPTLRRHEYDADLAASELTSPKTRAESLLRTAVKEEFLCEVYWKRVWANAEDQPSAPQDVFTRAYETLAGPIPEESAQTWLQAALDRDASATDTHPSLAERVAALGYDIPEDLSELVSRLASPLKENAASHYLGPLLEVVARQLDCEWVSACQAAWNERYQYAQQSKQTLADLAAKAANGCLTAGEAWTRANLTSEFDSEDAAIPLLREAISLDHGHASANLMLGRLLLDRCEEEGLECLGRAMERDPYAVIRCCELAVDFLQRHDRAEDAKRYQQQMEAQRQVIENAEKERRMLYPKDELLPVPLDEHLRGQIVGGLTPKFTDIEEMYVLTKKVQYLPQLPPRFLVIRRRANFVEWSVPKNEARLQKQIAQSIEWEDKWYVWVLNGDNALWKKIRKVQGAVVYKRTSR